MKNSERPLPLILRIAVVVVCAVVLVPLVLAVIAIVHGAAIPVTRWSAPLAAVLAGFITVKARGRFAAMWLVVWLGTVAYYATTFLRY